MAKQKHGSLIYQFNQRMKELDRIGESKHEAKQNYRQACERAHVPWNPAKADGIFAHKTWDAYKQSSMQFGAWLKETHREIKKINQIERSHVKEYLLQRQRENKSAWTISKDMSALNKVLNYDLNKREIGLNVRSYKHTERSRVDREHDKRYNPENYRDQILFAKAFGCRRESIVGGQYQVKELSLFKHEDKLYCSLIEKGGRYREAPCLAKYQSDIEKLYPNIQERDPMRKQEFKQMYQSSAETLFDRYTTKIDNHAYRHEYAKELYQEKLDQPDSEQAAALYRGYDKKIIQVVSQALGHNRLSVVVEHYLR
jgi:site-specific recombinase XerC